MTHLLAGALFSRAVGAIEAANRGRPFGPFWDELQPNAVATIFATVAGLEAYANELFVDHEKVFPELRSDVMAKMWELYEQKPTLEKLDLALYLLRLPPLDQSSSPYQDVSVLIRLRNALTHFKPEWSDQQVEHAKLSRNLAHKAVLSPFLPKSESLFPRGWMSHGTTSWAVRSAVGLITVMEQRGVQSGRIAQFAERLNAV
ncbi:MAG: hypothetical protein DI563_08000 [Variovorax paradoxus]|uniref:Uncharacterized protein n=1 Tax=Variovorax paradoxus TaxID=34073 RepID=A0A2W5QFL3_VARPD|nr:MAG: hypothetical protein DI563_08000 [Variovorax paradoxus]